MFRVSQEDAVEVRADFRRQHAVVAAPDFRRSRAAGVVRHFQRALGLVQVEREPHNIPAASQHATVFLGGGHLQNLNVGDILLDEMQPGRDDPLPAQPKQRVRSVGAPVVVQGTVTPDGAEQRSRTRRQNPLLLSRHKNRTYALAALAKCGPPGPGG